MPIKILVLGILPLLGLACSESQATPDTIGVWPDASQDAAEYPRFVSGPEISKNPNPAVPLAAVVKLATNVPIEVRLEISDGETTRKVAFRRTGKSFSLPVLGLEPDKKHSITVVISDGAGNETVAPTPLSFTTDPLPQDFPPLAVTVRKPSEMEPGVILFSPFKLAKGQGQHSGHTVVVNSEGKVVWFYESDRTGNTVRRLSNGNLLILYRRYFREIDMLGNVVQHWHSSTQADQPAESIPIDIDGFHHDILELPSGSFLVLSKEVRVFSDYPTSESDPNAPKATSKVAGDVVVELQRDGTIINKWPLLEMLDPYRIAYGSLGPYRATDAYDWSHANGLAYDKSNDAILVTVRHQDVVVKFSRKTGEVSWLLGTHANWGPPWDAALLAPKGKLEWPYHPHEPTITPAGTVLVFDNGNFRASPFAPPLGTADCYSRAVEYSVDETAMEVAEVWSFGGPGGDLFYSPSVSGVRWLPTTGNLLVTDGNRETDSSGKPTSSPDALRWARIVEVTHATPAEKVFEMVIKADKKADPVGWRIYRSSKLPSIYPSNLVH